MKPASPDLRHRLMGALAIVVGGLLVYANHLTNPFQFDTVRFIQENRLFAEPVRILSWDYFIGNYFSRSGLFWTLALNARWHGLDPFGFHLVNLMFHLMNALLVFGVSLQACRYFRLHTGGDESWAVALATALLFALHPIQTESVVYIMSRSELIAGWWYLLAFYLFQKAVDPEARPSSTYRFLVLPGAVALALVLGYSVKPTIATLPAAMLVYYLLGPDRKETVRRQLSRWRYGLLAGALPGLALLVYKLVSDPYFLAGSPAAVEQVGRSTYLLSQPWVIVFYYLRLMLFPINLNIDPDLPRVEQIGSVYFLSGTAVLVLGLWWAARAGNRVFLFGVLWYLLVLAPSSSFVTLLDLAAEHRVYLAGWGLIFPAVAGGVRLARRFPAHLRRPVLAGSCCLILLCLGLLTIHRNSVWASELRLWEDAHHKSPRKARPLVNLARAWTLAGDRARAIDYYEKALQGGRHFFQAHYNLAVLYVEQGREEEALKHFRLAAALDPKVPDVYGWLGEIYLRRGDLQAAEAHLRQAVELNPRYAAAFRSLGILYYFYLKDRVRARAFFARSLHLAPDQPDAARLRRLLAEGS